jgi:hypothetical protein
MRQVLLHYHILKNGGASMIEILRRSYWGTFAEFDLANPNAEITPPDLIAHLARNPHLNAISSHQIFYPVARAPGFLFYDICFLRDPLDRIRSIYDYFRGRPPEGDPMREMANQFPLGEFVRRLIAEMPWTMNDVQVNLLANGLINDQPHGAGDLEIATRRMLDTSFLGVVDLYNHSLVAGQHGLNAVFPGLNCVQAPVNDSAAKGSTFADRLEQFRAACEPEVYAELLRLNAMDLELLRRARAEVMRRFEHVPDRNERLRGLEKGVAILKARGDLPAEVVRPAEPVPALRKRWLQFAKNLRAARPGRDYRRLIDQDFYFSRYPDVRDSGMSALRHYVLHGAAEGRKPNALFEPAYYKTLCEEARDWEDPLLHFAEADPQTCANPHPLFDCAGWRAAHPESRENPLAEYLAQRRAGTDAPQSEKITLQDVEVRVTFPSPQFDSLPAPEQARVYEELRKREPSEAAILWLDACGEKKFLCAPQHKRFFACARYDQLAAQINAPGA